MAERRKLIAGNWKMNGRADEAAALARALAERRRSSHGRFDMLLCPPATLIAKVGEIIQGSGLQLGGQDCHAAEKGAFTGDISAVMLRDVGCSHVILGHSERRHGHGESNETVRAKTEAAHKASLNAIVCVGETEAERSAGKATDVVGEQLAKSLPQSAAAQNTVIAYEPVWAIGTGRTATAADVAEMHRFIRGILKTRLESADSVRILYGGSVKASNARELLAIDNVDGALVGGASLVADEFWAIGESCP